MKGKIVEFETMGLVDGPGMRLVVFMAGCALRCVYCHNPESWHPKSPYVEVSSEDVLNQYKKYSSYYGENGGVTFSGGEPLLQSEFVLETIKLLKQNNIHVAIDTAGYADEYDEILDLVDLVILDIKSTDANEYLKITEAKIDKFKAFLNACVKRNKKLWFRQVIVPGINDDEEHVLKLAELIKATPNVEKVELLPYHTMGVHKYEELGLEYKLEGVSNMDTEKCKELEKILKRAC